MSRPIEEGCRAVIVNSVCGNDGKEVRVIKLVDCVLFSGVGLSNKWVIDLYLLNEEGETNNTIGEHQLKRIDYDGDSVEKLEGFNLSDIWIPNRTGVEA